MFRRVCTAARRPKEEAKKHECALCNKSMEEKPCLYQCVSMPKWKAITILTQLQIANTFDITCMARIICDLILYQSHVLLLNLEN